MEPFYLSFMTGYAVLMSTMTKDEVISRLSRYTGSFPREAVEAAQNMWDEVADDMLAALRHAADNPEELVEDTGASLHTYAMYLCAEKRETRALDPFLRMMSYSDERVLDVLLGDTLTEAGGRIIASLFAGDLQPIYQLAENRDAYDFSRGQAVRSLSVLVVNGALERDTVIAYLRELFEGRIERSPSAVWNDVAEAAAALAAGELHSEVEQAFEDEIIDLLFDTPESILADVDRDVDTAMESLKSDPRYSLIGDTVQEMEWWAAFRDENEKPSHAGAWNALLAERLGGTIRKEEPKVSRNAPCPCGSGRKYKKCCGR